METPTSTGYGKPPWTFRGRALYQLHLVKSNVARALIPKDFRLVQAFGYTLGGFFLANYDHSPAGAFDELVVIAGIVWNPPTSCAMSNRWASKVLVNSNEACLHGQREVGLPSHVARFTKVDSIDSSVWNFDTLQILNVYAAALAMEAGAETRNTYRRRRKQRLPLPEHDWSSSFQA